MAASKAWGLNQSAMSPRERTATMWGRSGAGHCATTRVPTFRPSLAEGLAACARWSRR